MRYLSRLIVLVLEVFIVALALNALLSGFLGLPESPVVELLPDSVRPAGPWSVRFYWIVLLALPVLHALLLVAMFRRQRAVVFQTSPTDSLSLAQSAISQCVRTELAEVPAIVKHKVIVTQSGRRGIDLRIELKVRPIENIPEMQARLGRQIRRALSDILGLDNIRQIKLDVTSIEEPRKRRSDSAIPVARRLEGPRGRVATAAQDSPATPSARPAAPPADAADAEFSVEAEEPSTHLRRDAPAPVYEARTVDVTPSIPESRPEEIHLGDFDAAPEPAPGPGSGSAPVIKTDDILEILGRNKSEEKRKTP